MDDLLRMLKGTWIRRRVAGDRRGFVVGKSISAAAMAALAAVGEGGPRVEQMYI